MASPQADPVDPRIIEFQLTDRSRRFIRTDGAIEPQLSPWPMASIRSRLQAQAQALDSVNLRHLGEPLMVMILNDRGYQTEPVTLGGVLHLEPTEALLPVNEIATALYHANCKPGTTNQIVGDVFICPDEDFA